MPHGRVARQKWIRYVDPMLNHPQLTPFAPDRPLKTRAAGVKAILGPTNTGKTHMAIERMLGYPTGMMGLPLRLLAREVYDKVCTRTASDNVALVTGEEKIIPASPRYWICTVEAMPQHISPAFVALDEAQLCADADRGRVFTHRLLNQRGHQETWILGSLTLEPWLQDHLPGLHVETRERLSTLSFSGEKKLSRLPPRTAVVAFSVEDVYEIAEALRRQRGGAAVVIGALSPRTRNAQVALFQNGDVDVLVATDAIGMGLNLDVDHVAFAARRKFDGQRFRNLTLAEMGQIAGRAGRYKRDGTFGTTAGCPALAEEEVEALQNHQFPAITEAYWRNPQLDTSTLAKLLRSLDEAPTERGLTRAAPADDAMALSFAQQDDDVRQRATTPTSVALLWDVCQIPDYRKISPAWHGELVVKIFRDVHDKGALDATWFSEQVSKAIDEKGSLETLMARLADIRTWSYVANQGHWLAQSALWQQKTKAIEEKLSDALHERLTQRFVNRQTSVLFRRMRETRDMTDLEVTPTGNITMAGENIGTIEGLRFLPSTNLLGPDAKDARNRAIEAAREELNRRLMRLSSATDETLVLTPDGGIRWQGERVAMLAREETPLKPGVRILAEEGLSPPLLESALQRLRIWVEAHINEHLKPLLALANGEGLEGTARGLAYKLAEGFGIIPRAEVAGDIKELPQERRATLRAMGVRFGAHHIFVPATLKPAPRTWIAALWSLQQTQEDTSELSALLQSNFAGRTSITADETLSGPLYRTAGFAKLGSYAVRIDILERLSDLIRSALTPQPQGAPTSAGFVDGRQFTVTPAMLSVLGIGAEGLATVLANMGYESTQVPNPALETTQRTPTPTEPSSTPLEASTEPSSSEPLLPEKLDTLVTQDVTTTHNNEPPANEELALDQNLQNLAPNLHQMVTQNTDQQKLENGAEKGPQTPAPTITLWRLKRRQPEAGRQQEKQKKTDAYQKDRPRYHKPDNAKKQGSKAAKPYHEQREKRSKTPDPDSPFAALLNIKFTKL